MRLCSLASGSDGNCVYVGSENTAILIDAGISGKRIEEGLEKIGVKPGSIQAVMITHEHSDHIKGIGVLARKYNIPIYGTAETICSALKFGNIGKIPSDLLNQVVPDTSLQIGDLLIEPFSMSHDASNPVCYTVKAGDRKCGMATDLGCFDEYIIEKLSDSDILYLEANHDENMLMVGRYPYFLKQRILGSRGHLSNDTSARLVCELLNDKLKYILLAHLSKENNYAELAYETVRVEVEQHWCRESELPVIQVANRDIPSEILEV